MKIFDQIAMCLQNLSRRKVRTAYNDGGGHRYLRYCGYDFVGRGAPKKPGSHAGSDGRSD